MGLETAWAGLQDDVLPLGMHPAFRADSAEAAARRGAGLIGPHTVRIAGGGAFAAAANAVRLRDVTIGSFSYGAAVVAETVGPRAFYAVNLPISGSMLVDGETGEIAADQGVAAVLPPTGPLRIRWGEGLAVLSVMIARDALERQLARMTGSSVASPIRFAPGMPLAAGPAWWAIVRFAMSLVETPATPAAVAELERAMMSMLLLTQPHDRAAELLDDGDGSDRLVDDALEAIRRHHEGEVTVGSIARAVGVSERTLELAFRRRTGRTPVSHLRDARLDEVRERLLSTSAGELTIARAAAESGFGNLGRLAAAYRARFGERPSETPRRLSR